MKFRITDGVSHAVEFEACSASQLRTRCRQAWMQYAQWHGMERHISARTVLHEQLSYIDRWLKRKLTEKPGNARALHGQASSYRSRKTSEAYRNGMLPEVLKLHVKSDLSGSWIATNHYGLDGRHLGNSAGHAVKVGNDNDWHGLWVASHRAYNHAMQLDAFCISIPKILREKPDLKLI